MRRWPLLLALALALGTGAPFLFGRGVDVPDDALYYELASWEWLRFAWQHGLSPWFVPGKLGGVSLFVDTVPMGPFYPAIALLWILPAGVALPLAAVLHGLGTLLTVRWFARVLGASPEGSTLAGAAVAVGPLGTFGFVDERGIAWATLLWLPVAMGAFERARQDPGRRWRWIGLCGAALALLLLGSHVRLSAGALAVFALWAGTAGRSAILAAPALGLGLLAGAPGYLPILAEWGQASRSAGLIAKVQSLRAPAESGMTLASLPGLLAPRPWPSYADYSLGAVLVVALLLIVGRGPLRLRQPGGRAALVAGILLAAALSPALGPVRWVFAPLLLLTHPVDDVYSALAMIPAAAAAALAFDALTDGRLRPRPWRLLLPAALLLGSWGVIRWQPQLLRDERALHLVELGLAQALIVTALALLLFGRKARGALLLLALLDLGTIAMRLQLAVPSDPLPLLHRTDVPGVEQLRGGYLDVDDLARLEPFRYGEQGAAPPAEPEFWEDTARDMQAQILHRRWPAHLGMARGYRGLSGRAKLMPRRQAEALSPLVSQIQAQSIDGEELRALFEDRGALGARTLALFGIPVAAAPDGVILRAPEQVPPCYIAPGARWLPDPEARVAAVFDPAFWPERSEAIVEDPALERPPGSEATLRCEGTGATLSAREPTLVVFRERYHPGWLVRTEDGPLPTFPVNVVHLGVVVPPGEHRLSRRFVPLGLHRALALAGLGWLLLGWLGSPRLRRGKSGPFG